MGAVAGRVMIMPKGPYDNNTLYKILDAVTFHNKLWLAKKSNLIGVEPSEDNGDSWMLSIDGTTDVNEVGEAIDALTLALKEKVGVSSVVETNLVTSDWTAVSDTNNDANFSYTVSIPEMLETNIVEITYNGSTITKDQFETYRKAEIDFITQSDGSLTLYAYGVKPKIDLPIVFIVRKDVI